MKTNTWYAKQYQQGMIIDEETGETIAVTYTDMSENTAAFIVTACNAHDALLAALDTAVALLGCYQAGTEVPPVVLARVMSEARDAISKAHV